MALLNILANIKCICILPFVFIRATTPEKYVGLLHSEKEKVLA